ncbi:serine hydroxymethyltransferase [Aggregatibacter actinomycetemcomitans]|uniref:Uncharacterized protein n=1 Tax=Aggregatibacter actinomycetemcomitans TaxID=714 RepID=O50557_AGGAC|nr:serine hydroxymethyltransferase [Aggregatibacter actinomycetemcomitans]AAB88722.1 orfX [Aggregatibacter actinomycetemcomitans]EHK89517.1 hypothetical protein RHAA1_09266 [Aggregatibacter actinomycetemcomitans RhAA1]KNE76621.1 serine hydroxymethyltransferase [Aggregatibacter actinomycetemcomitans RhAA1]MBN6070458.1 serine hydroxymethyltransferase [Aggregatibacter actinomycetemcomitans]MBN6078112.1 serine hydroxymethyltransferase [Aggregatibacter actinomycetemcomitans]
MSGTEYAPFYLRFIQFPNNEVSLCEYWQLVQNSVKKIRRITVIFAQIIGTFSEKAIWKYQGTFNDGILEDEVAKDVSLTLRNSALLVASAIVIHFKSNFTNLLILSQITQYHSYYPVLKKSKYSPLYFSCLLRRRLTEFKITLLPLPWG